MTTTSLLSSPALQATDFSLAPFPHVAAMPILTVESQDWAYQFQMGVKRLFDCALAALGLLSLLPLLLLIAVLIKVFSPGPIFYKSLRIGKFYQPFYMYKFRTMAINADARRDDLRQQAQLEGNLFKLKNDPRVTPIGQLLRKYSLDELPQLLNVLVGNMSLVGPRPLPPDESKLFEAPYTLRFKALPGITGLWQISGRSSLSFESLCRLELSYVIHWSVFQDLLILLKTFPVVVLRRGAY